MIAAAELQRRESGPAHEDRTGSFGAEVDRERAAVRAEIKAAWLSVPQVSNLWRVVLPCTTSSGWRESRTTAQETLDGLSELITQKQVDKAFRILLTADTAELVDARRDLLLALADAYADVVANDVGDLRAGELS